MHAASPTIATKQPLFIFDFFDHDEQSLVDSRVCHSLAEGAAAFDDFLLMAEPVTSGPLNGALISFAPFVVTESIIEQSL